MDLIEEPIDEKKKEEQYFHFFSSILLYHRHLLSLHHTKFGDLENDLIYSIHLIWQMHVMIFSLKSLFYKAKRQNILTSLLKKDQLNDLIYSLEQLKIEAECSPFTNEMNKKIYINLLQQIMQYYYDGQHHFNDMNAEPWFSNPQISPPKIMTKKVDE